MKGIHSKKHLVYKRLIMNKPSRKIKPIVVDEIWNKQKGVHKFPLDPR